MTPNTKLKECRLNKGLSQWEVAKAVSIVPDYYSMIERGVRTPGFLLSKKIADYFGHTVDELFFANMRNIAFCKEKNKVKEAAPCNGRS